MATAGLLTTKLRSTKNNKLLSESLSTSLVIATLLTGFILVLIASLTTHNVSYMVTVSIGVFACHLLVVLLKIASAKLSKKTTRIILISLVASSIVAGGIQMIASICNSDATSIISKKIILSLIFSTSIAVLLVVQYMPLRLLSWSPLLFFIEGNSDVLHSIGMKTTIKTANIFNNIRSIDNFISAHQQRSVGKMNINDNKMTISRDMIQGSHGKSSKHISSRFIETRKKDENSSKPEANDAVDRMIEDVGFSFEDKDERNESASAKLEEEDEEEVESEEKNEEKQQQQRLHRNDMKKMY